MNRSELKRIAKERLGNGIFKNEWLYALLYLLVVSAILSAASVTGVGAIIVTGPLTYAITKAFLNAARTGEKMNLNTLFDGFKDDFGGTLLLSLLIGIFVCLWSMLFVIPGIVKSYAYSMAFYIKADHPDYDWKKCIDESKRITKGHKGELFVLDLSFIGWFFVGSLVCGLGTLWVMPYMEMTKANAYLWLTSLDAPAAAPVIETAYAPVGDPAAAPTAAPVDETVAAPVDEPAAPADEPAEPADEPAAPADETVSE